MTDWAGHIAVVSADEQHERFVMTYRDVWEELRGKSSLSVHMALRWHCTPERHEWFGTRRALAAEAGVSVGTFDRGIRHLESIGLVTVVARFAPAGWKGDPAVISFARSEATPVQIGNLYRVRSHLPQVPPSSNLGTPPLPKNDETPYPNLETPSPQNWVTEEERRDEELREGGEVVETSSAAPGDAPSPHPTLDDLAAAHAADATPDTWSTPDDPRCRAHAGLPRQEVPACRDCAHARSWFEGQASMREQIAVERRLRRQLGREGCETCRGTGRRDEVNRRTGLVMEVPCHHSEGDAAASALSA